MSETKKKSCFVITPIGNEESVIRRHIDGIIDQAIIPALGDKYEINVAHRKYEIGSITDRVIRSVYDSDLVIANLTTLNPNVMFELAIRYSFGKPAIVIAEEGTKLPFDIVEETAIFYVNDPTGANALKEKIAKFERNIDITVRNYGPVQKAIQKTAIYNEVESGDDISQENALKYIIDRLSILENNLIYNKDRDSAENKTIIIRFFEDISDDSQKEISDHISHMSIDFLKRAKIFRIIDAYWDGNRTFYLHIKGYYCEEWRFIPNFVRQLSNREIEYKII